MHVLVWYAALTTCKHTCRIFVCAWHNCDYDEDSPGCRVLYSLSTTDGLSWSSAQELFPRLADPIARNGSSNATITHGANVYSTGFQAFGDRLYAFAGVKNNQCASICRASGEGRGCCSRCRAECCPCATLTNLPQMLRRIVLTDSTANLGAVFWLARRAEMATYNLSAKEMRAISRHAFEISEINNSAVFAACIF